MAKEIAYRDVMLVWVTSKNHEWASNIIGLPEAEITAEYDRCRAKKVICTLQVTQTVTSVNRDV